MTGQPLGFDLAAAVDATVDEMVDTRRQLHAHPELSFAETATTALIADRLGGLGFTEAPRPTPTGGIWTLEGGRPGRTAALRADIDALPVHEQVDVPFRSTVDGVMHACGHDVHTAALLGVARLLSEHRDDVAGRYVLVFQPGEEGMHGALSMIEGGAMDALAGARMVGFHVASLVPTGWAAVRPGIAMAEVHSVHLRISGAGGHGAMPSARGDVVRATGVLIGRLAGVVDGLAYEGMDCTCHAGMVRAGSAANVVPTRASLHGTLRTFTDDQREEAMDRLRTLCHDVGEEQGVTVALELPGHAPAVVNDGAVTEVVERSLRQELGTDDVFAMPPVTPSDDVSEFLDRMPGCYYFVGGALPDGSSGMHHSPTFALDEGSLRVGALTMAGAALALARPG